MNKIKLVSELDNAINYVIPHTDGGYFESRFVQRSPDYFIIYLSSHTGCNQACRMCHLTQSKQTMMTPSTLDDYIQQTINVIKDVDFELLKSKGLKRIKYSFMARGEPLLNPTLTNNWDELRKSLKNLIPNYFDVEFNVSTIYPKEFHGTLEHIFKTSDTIIYYSIYSVRHEFRKKWLGKSHNFNKALIDLRSLKNNTQATVKFHSAFIEGENDSIYDVELLDFCLSVGFLGAGDNNTLIQLANNYDFNIVKYNPYSNKFGKETDDLNLLNIKKILGAKIKSRVGMDVQASCGMFYKD